AEYFRDGDHQYDALDRPLSTLHDEVFPQLEKGETIIWNERIKERYQELGHIPAAGKIPKTAVLVPLKIEGKINSVISLQDTEKEFAFSTSTIRLLETLAGSMGVALENAQLFEETQRLLQETEARNAELAVINSVQTGLASKLDMQAIYDLVGDKIRDVFDAQIVTIVSYDRTNQQNIIRESGCDGGARGTDFESATVWCMDSPHRWGNGLGTCQPAKCRPRKCFQRFRYPPAADTR
ncbi:MAG: GAF domain-containing protein, partial [Anaerolineales bacterium]